MICLSFHGAEFCQSEWEFTHKWSTCFMIDPCLIGQSAVFIGVNCDILYDPDKGLTVKTSFLCCSISWPGAMTNSSFTVTMKLPENQCRRLAMKHCLFLYSKSVHVDSHEHIVIPQGGRDDMIRASFCPSETSVCHILVTRCVQRRQGCKYNIRTCL